MERADTRAFAIVRLDAEAEVHAPSVFGGDPATARKRLPMAGQTPPRPPRPPATELVRTSGAKTLSVVAPDVTRARALCDRFPDLPHVELRLGDWTGLDALVRERDVTRVEARTPQAVPAARLPATPCEYRHSSADRQACRAWPIRQPARR